MSTLYLIYDGDCILCRNSAQAIKIKETVGHLQLINARTSHLVVTQALEKGYDLNEGILVQFNDQYYYGADAVHFLALVGNPVTIFNRLNYLIFKHTWLAKLFYPVFKSIRNLIFKFKGIPAIPQPTLVALINKIFANQVNDVPQVLQSRYANRPYSNDALLMRGEMNVLISPFFRRISPLLRMVCASVPYSADKIPATVEMISQPNSNSILMKRSLYYSEKSPYQFTSRVIHVKDNQVLEVMRFRFAIRLLYRLENETIYMDHGGYVFCLGKHLIPIPLNLLLGRSSAFEIAVTDQRFKMQVRLDHALFGKIFQYDGYFDIANQDNDLSQKGNAGN